MLKLRISAIIRSICTLILVLFLSIPAMAQYSGGTGEPNNPYQIADANDWIELMNTSIDWAKNFIMTADIDLNDISLSPVGISSSQSFRGVFDGNDHVIYNAYINMPSSHYVGLFGYIDSNGQIQNLGLENVNISGFDTVGGLVGRNVLGNITNCYNTGVVSGHEVVAGLVGENFWGTVTGCCSTVTISGGYSVGGLIGYNVGDVNNSYSTGSVSGYGWIGGLVGSNAKDIINSYFSGTVNGRGSNVGGLVGGTYDFSSVLNCTSTGTVNGDNHVGGLVGRNRGTVTNCNSISTVSGDDYVGGLLGASEYGIVLNSYSICEVSGDSSVGGLVGGNYDCTLLNCYSRGTVYGDYGVGGLVGGNSGDLTNCYSTCTISGYDTVGGLMGGNYGDVASCYSINTVNGSDDVGGLIGENYGDVTNCYSICAVSGFINIGGLVGNNKSDYTVNKCYSTGTISGYINVGGLIGVNGGDVNDCFWDIEDSNILDGVANMDPDPNGVTGKTTIEMQYPNTFLDAGWDFIGEMVNGPNDIWWILEGKDYPRLWWQLPVDDFNDCNAAPLWASYGGPIWLEETNGRLEVNSISSDDSGGSFYLSDGWQIDVNEPFAARVDFHFSKSGEGYGGVSLGIRACFENYYTTHIAHCEACSINDHPYYSYQVSYDDWIDMRLWDRLVDDGVLYISYDPNSDELYFSNLGYGPDNAVYTVPGLIKGFWQCESIGFDLEISSQGMILTGEDAWLDNFAIDEGAIKQ